MDEKEKDTSNEVTVEREENMLKVTFVFMVKINQGHTISSTLFNIIIFTHFL